LPGRAWLQFKAQAQTPGGTLLSQTAFFAPRGLSGLLYWYALYPVHQIIFSGMIRGVAARITAAAPAAAGSPGRPRARFLGR
jgi:hypothetical protein